MHTTPVGVPSKKAVVGWRHSNIPIVGSTSHIVIVGGHITLPAPRDGKEFYSRSEAANIIYSAGPKGYHLRGKVSARMVELKLVPVGRKSLTDLMQLRDGGKPIEDDPWRRKSKAKADGGCGGIQSSKLDAVAGSNYTNTSLIPCSITSMAMGPTAVLTKISSLGNASHAGVHTRT